MKRTPFALLLLSLLALATAFFFRHSLYNALIPNPRLAPEIEALNRHFPLYGELRGPLPLTGDIEIPKTQAGKELHAYYRENQREPPWRTALGRLVTKDSAERSLAESYLCDLLDQALKDEEAGVAPWQASPFWGSGGFNPSRGLRERVAAALLQA